MKEIGSLTIRVLLANGANEETAQILADLLTVVERDGPRSHGLSMLTSYAASIRGGLGGWPRRAQSQTSGVEVDANLLAEIESLAQPV